MGKVHTRFQTKKAQRPYPLERHILIWFIWGESPPREIIRSWKDIDSFNIISYFSSLLFVFARVHLQGLEGGSMAFVWVFLVIQTENWSATSSV